MDDAEVVINVEDVMVELFSISMLILLTHVGFSHVCYSSFSLNEHVPM